jgi:hypothetical protein
VPVPAPAWAAVQVLSHEHAVPIPVPLHDWFARQEAAVTETKGQPWPSTVQVDAAPVPAQNVPLPVHAASLGALQAHAALPGAPAQLWCVPHGLMFVTVTQVCASAVHVVTSVPLEQYEPAWLPAQIVGAVLQWQAPLGTPPTQVWSGLGQVVGPAVMLWQRWASSEQVLSLPLVSQNVPAAVQPAGSALQWQRPVVPSQNSFAVHAVVASTKTQLWASGPQWTDAPLLQTLPMLPLPVGQTLGAGLQPHEPTPFAPEHVWCVPQFVEWSM